MNKINLQKDEIVPWNMLDMVLFLVLLILLMIFGRQFVIYLTTITTGKLSNYSIVMFSLFCSFSFFVVLKIILKKYDNGWHLLLSGIECFLANFVSSVQLSFVLGVGALILNCYITPFLFPGLFLKPSGITHLSIFLLFPIFVAPVTEEIWFRSFFFRGIKKKFGFMPGLIISTFLFSLYHYYNFAGPSIIFFSIVMTIYYEKTNALYNCIFIHSMANIIFYTGLFFYREPLF